MTAEKVVKQALVLELGVGGGVSFIFPGEIHL